MQKLLHYLIVVAASVTISLPAYADYVQLSPASAQTGDINITGTGTFGGDLNVSGTATLGELDVSGSSNIGGVTVNPNGGNPILQTYELQASQEVDTQLLQNTSGHSLTISGVSQMSGGTLSVVGTTQLDLERQSGSYITTLNFATPTANKTAVVPNVNGNVVVAQTTGPEVEQSGDLVIGGTINADGGLTIGGGSAAINSYLSATASEGSQSLSGTSGCNSFTVSVPGAAMGDTVLVSVDQSLPGSWTLSGNVSSSGTVTVKACAFDNSTSISAGNYRVDVWHQ